MTTSDIEKLTRSFIETLVWLTHDEDAPDCAADLIAPESLERIKVDCAKFGENNQESIDNVSAVDTDFEGDAWEQAGHDFCLTRNGHGVGFWDGDWPEPWATALDKSAKSFGELGLYRGDDGLYYVI